MTNESRRKSNARTPAAPSDTPWPSDAIQRESPMTEERIRNRAYELYEQRGGEEGHDVDDWLQAEHELRGTIEPA